MLALFIWIMALHADAASNPAPKTKSKPATGSKQDSKATSKENAKFTEATSRSNLETYQDLILKAQNLSLQQDRLQASQVLIRGMEREPKASVAFKEMARSLEDLTSVFYTEKAQSFASTGDSLAEEKPKEAVDSYLEALKSEDANVSILKSLARTYLRIDECDKAEARVKNAEDMNPYSPEIKLLRIQTLLCQKKFDELSQRLDRADTGEFAGVEKYLSGVKINEAIREKDLKRARAELGEWETKAPGYPEIHFWKWELSKLGNGPGDRAEASKYVQSCQALPVRKRKLYALDVSLCRAKEAAEIFLKQSESKSAPPPAAKEEQRNK